MPNPDLGMFLGVYAALSVISTAATAGECWQVTFWGCPSRKFGFLTAARRVFFIHVINNTALELHSDLLEATLRQAR